MHVHALWYSTDLAVTLGQLKAGDYVYTGDDHHIHQTQAWLDSHGVTAMVLGEENYFYGFSLLPNSPYIVYAMGDVSLLQRPKISIVGPRAITDYGKQVCQSIFAVLPGYDVITVSGAADGVDMLCHTLSLQSAIPTIVVLGGGLRWFWRSGRHSFLQKVIDAGGLILSEFKLDMKPTHYTFPQRNRIVAGLGDVVCVPEARSGSGSLITVDFALQMRKPIYGAPNSIFASGSEGLFPYMASKKIDIMYDPIVMLDAHYSPVNNSATITSIQDLSLDPLQQTILQLCADGDMTLAQISQHTTQAPQLLLEAISMLEMYDLLYQSSPSVYRIAQKIAKPR